MPSIDTAVRDRLLKSAGEARQRAYAPYSQFSVGAAVLTEDGSVFAGCNVENASYGLTVCAERNAIFQAVAAGHRQITAIAVATGPGATMCGACRQVTREFAVDLPVFHVDEHGAFRETTLVALLPEAFGPDPGFKLRPRDRS